MAEKSDDIKNLFSNLGLNPRDYHEIRSAPTANATVNEAPRRWSLLQTAAPTRNLSIASVVAPVAAPVGPATRAPITASPKPAAPAVGRALPSVRLAAAEGIVRAEEELIYRGAQAVGEPTLTVEPSSLAISRSAVFAPPSSNDGLQTLFRSVKEPQTAPVLPKDIPHQAERRIDQPHKILGNSSSAAPISAISAGTMGKSDEPENRYAVPLAGSRLGPTPSPIAAPAAMPKLEMPGDIAATPVRLKFNAAATDAAIDNDESLHDVFRRLSRDNRGRSFNQ